MLKPFLYLGKNQGFLETFKNSVEKNYKFLVIFV